MMALQSRKLVILLLMIFGLTNAYAQNLPAPEDPWLWLEEVSSDASLEWARARNAVSQAVLAGDPQFEEIRLRMLEILDSDERIPSVTKRGDWVYNFWRDQDHVQGIWRRTTLDQYRETEPVWQVVLDLDSLAASENENWVWKGAQFLYPDNNRALLNLSRGGADAVVVREFDLETLSFVENGFVLEEAKSDVSWIDIDTLYVGTNFGEGSQTDSGYSRIAKRWSRGTPLAFAETVFEGENTDVWAGAYVINDHGYKYEFAATAPTFFTEEAFLLNDGNWEKIATPPDADTSTFGELLMIRLVSPWDVGGKHYDSGVLLSINFSDFMQGGRDFDLVFEPNERTALESFITTKNYLISNVLDNVRSRIFVHELTDEGWTRQELPTPGLGTVSVRAVDDEESDEYFLSFSDLLTPSSLFIASVESPEPVLLKSLPAFFNTEGLSVQQNQAVSKDGTQVPYFIVSSEQAELDGTNPTLLYGYGGFEISMTPDYSATVGSGWLERGGIYVLANIRGGGEFGPDWHNSVRRENRQLAYDDFIAIAEDLIEREVTSTEHLGIHGRSNGGLLTGVMLTQRPDLFGAVVSEVPLLDMRRYNKLLAGASWMDEYGNPDVPADWDFIKEYSPYQNIDSEAAYPPTLFTTSTRDDRVHPGHARKMVARMQEQGHQVLYYENIEGGHGGAANNQQAAFMRALTYTFLWQNLK